MHGWIEFWAHQHANELIDDAGRRRLARGLNRAKRGDSVVPDFVREVAGRTAGLARAAPSGKGVVEQPK
jgi:hypothetical protein